MQPALVGDTSPFEFVDEEDDDDPIDDSLSILKIKDVGLDNKALQAAALSLNISPSEVVHMIEHNELVSYFDDDTLVIPNEQFCDGRVILGILEVVKLFDMNHYLAWMFLDDVIYYGDIHPTPLSKLRESQSKEDTYKLLYQFNLSKSSLDWGSFL